MTNVAFGFGVPCELRPERWATFLDDLNRALDLAEGTFDSAWMVDHLQFGDAGVLEGFTALAYLTALHVEQLDEALQIVKALWTQEAVTFEGTHYRVVEARCEPRPDPVPPIVIGAFGPKMLRLTAQHADVWDVSSTRVERYRRLAEEFGRACAEVGRDPATVRRSWSGGCACARTRAEADALAGGRISDDDENFDFVGTPEQLVEQMRPFVSLGVDRFILDCVDFPRPTGLELLINEVLPALRG